MSKFTVGAIEIAQLPDLGIQDLQMRVDTGAKTSSLHVDDIETYQRRGRPWIRFNIHPNVHKVEEVKACEAPVHDVRRIKSSNAQVEERYVILTTLSLGEHHWKIELSLTDRSDMSFLMLLGREAMGDRLLVDPSERYLQQTDE